MEPFILTDGLLVGHEQIDGEHAELVGILNDCIAIINAGGGVVDFRPRLNDLNESLRRHVRNEEALMADLGYEIAAAEHNYHQDGMARLATLCLHLDEGQDVHEFIADLKHLLVVTFLMSDMGLKAFIPELRKRP